ncbi:hypothetical protein ATKI12_6744 [Kitasatospora sp. Ki12]
MSPTVQIRPVRFDASGIGPVGIVQKIGVVESYSLAFRT